MRPSRGMGAMKAAKIPGAMPNKMPAGKVKARRDNTDFTQYKKGGEVMAKGGKWIQEAIKKPGALKSSLGVKKGEKIPAGKLATAAKAKGKLGQRARLAQTLKGLKK
jgi:hypothetical protein